MRPRGRRLSVSGQIRVARRSAGLLALVLLMPLGATAADGDADGDLDGADNCPAV
jgi:hypothetical protein